MNRRIRSTLILGIVAVAAPAAAQETPGGQAAPVDLTVATRPAEDRARDEFFKPIEVFEWIGVEPGDVVLDFHAGSGYNTWILSQWVGPQGVVFTESPEQYAEDLKIRLESGDLAGAGNVVFVEQVSALPTDSLDLFYTSRNYHDIPAGEIPALLAEVDRVLVPGGTFVVIDARADEGRDTEAHRIADQVIIDEVTAAGFELIDQSAMLANPEDDHVGPKWDQRERLDQSLIKFRAPEAEGGEAGA